ncbi:MAG: hypothetical protein AAFY71_05650 [Bacteroidota bacterium]
MRRFLYLFTFICINLCILSTQAQTITVTNAGSSEVNGVYTFVKLLNSKPSYSKGIYRIYWDNTKWLIRGNAKTYYTHQDDGLIIQSFGWELGEHGAVPFPDFQGEVVTLGLNLLDLEAEPFAIDKAALSWSHPKYNQLAGFEIQRSEDGLIWKKIGFVPPSSSDEDLHHYMFVDQYPLPGLAIYRIKQIDVQGNFVLSEKVSLQIGQISYLHLLAKPNRTQSEGQIEVELISSEKLGRQQLNLRNYQGQVIHSWSVETGVPIKLSLPKLMKGLYILESKPELNRIWTHLLVE